MCTICGCQSRQPAWFALGRKPLPDAPQTLDFGANAAGVTVPGLSEQKVIELEARVLSRNDATAASNRAWFEQRHIFALNLVSSPGSGKTTLLVETLRQMDIPVAVIEGDQQTALDAERIAATGKPVLQINTGKGCHLDAEMIEKALPHLNLPQAALLLIENVGNLVCPAGFDLGEAHKVVVLSVTEGEDKPLKYPDMFAAADVFVLTKIDLLPYTGFDVERCLEYARRINPNLRIFQLSARTGEGMSTWIEWLSGRGKG